MYRLAAILLWTLVPLGLLAAPAPEPRPWFIGWYKPVDPVGDCKFDRKGDKLTITVPGEGHELVAGGRLNGPRVLRGVEGDFVAVVRLAGVSPPPTSEDGHRGAGLLLASGTTILAVEHFVAREVRRVWTVFFARIRLLGETCHAGSFGFVLPLGRPVYLRLERRGDILRAGFSEDGKRWTWVDDFPKLKLARKVKVGVFAESIVPGEFKPTFDQFKLSRPRK